MTHLFYIHSNITLLSAIAVVQKFCLDKVCFFYGRGFNNKFIKTNLNIIYVNEHIMELSKIPTNGSINLIKNINALKELDKLLNYVGGSYFECYLPSTRNFLMQAIITHPRCRCYNIIEEGTLTYMHPSRYIKAANSYYQAGVMGKFKGLLKYPMHKYRSIVYCPIRATLNNIYMFNFPANKFENFNIKTIDTPKIDITLPDYSDQNIFLFDNTVGDNVMNHTNYFNVLRKIMSQFKTRHLKLKFHPAQNDRNEILNLLNDLNIDYEELSIDIPMELVFYKSRNINIYGIFSSLLLYAGLSGHTVYSFLNYAKGISAQTDNWIEKEIPEIFYKFVELVPNLENDLNSNEF